MKVQSPSASAKVASRAAAISAGSSVAGVQMRPVGPMPEAAFYLWVKTPGDDQIFARELYREKAVTVLPGSFLSRPVNGIDPAAGFVRLALVSEPELGLEAAQRIRDFVKEHY